jgi:hypothetical protein
MVVGAMQCFFVILLITAFIGMSRGFMREAITMAIVLASILFLANGGNGLIHQFFFVNLPNAFRVLLFGGSAVSTGDPTVSQANTAGDALFALASFLGLMGLGYGVGHKYGPPATTNQHHIGGILPGLVNGAAISYYFTNSLLPQFQLDLNTPSDTLTAFYLPIILGFGLLALIVILLVSSMSKKGAKGGGGGGGH